MRWNSALALGQRTAAGLRVIVALLASGALCVPMPTAAQRARSTVADGENKWVAFPPPDQEGYLYGFIYIDPAAGFTIDVSGKFTIDPEGKYVKVSGSSPAGHRQKNSPDCQSVCVDTPSASTRPTGTYNA